MSWEEGWDKLGLKVETDLELGFAGVRLKQQMDKNTIMLQ